MKLKDFLSQGILAGNAGADSVGRHERFPWESDENGNDAPEILKAILGGGTAATPGYNPHAAGAGITGAFSGRAQELPEVYSGGQSGVSVQAMKRGNQPQAGRLTAVQRAGEMQTLPSAPQQTTAPKAGQPLTFRQLSERLKAEARRDAAGLPGIETTPTGQSQGEIRRGFTSFRELAEDLKRRAREQERGGGQGLRKLDGSGEKRADRDAAQQYPWDKNPIPKPEALILRGPAPKPAPLGPYNPETDDYDEGEDLFSKIDRFSHGAMRNEAKFGEEVSAKKSGANKGAAGKASGGQKKPSGQKPAAKPAPEKKTPAGKKGTAYQSLEGCRDDDGCTMEEAWEGLTDNERKKLKDGKSLRPKQLVRDFANFVRDNEGDPVTIDMSGMKEWLRKDKPFAVDTSKAPFMKADSMTIKYDKVKGKAVFGLEFGGEGDSADTVFFGKMILRPEAGFERSPDGKDGKSHPYLENCSGMYLQYKDKLYEVSKISMVDGDKKPFRVYEVDSGLKRKQPTKLIALESEAFNRAIDAKNFANGVGSVFNREK